MLKFILHLFKKKKTKNIPREDGKTVTYCTIIMGQVWGQMLHLHYLV